MQEIVKLHASNENKNSYVMGLSKGGYLYYWNNGPHLERGGDTTCIADLMKDVPYGPFVGLNFCSLCGPADICESLVP